jgi:hypothetical protein
VGADEKELLRKIRAELGADAVILHSTYGKRSGLLKFFARPRIEIVAGGGFRIVKDYANGEAPAAGPASRNGGASAETLQKEIGEIKRLISETRTMVSTRNAVEGPQELTEEYASLATM